MKEAMWGLGLILFCLLTFVIIGVIGNITLTNQQDYYGVKQTTEAGAYDSVDQVKFKRGICVCTTQKAGYDGKIKFTSKSQYEISEPTDDNECKGPEGATCQLMLGEYVLDPKLFVESVITRLGSIVKPTEEYDVTIQEVIPYPPKVSVNIEFKQALNIDGEDRIHQIIPNMFDGIFEDTGAHSVLEYKENELPDWDLGCEPDKPQTQEEKPSEPEKPSESKSKVSGGQCKCWYEVSSIQCQGNTQGIVLQTYTSGFTTVSQKIYKNQSDAKTTCQKNAATFCSNKKYDGKSMSKFKDNCQGYCNYNVYDKDNKKLNSSPVKATSEYSAIMQTAASKCGGSNAGCYARCTG